ncbi:Ldh family oxidoreductase [Bradyrhizobium nitroreducens]|uniref:Ldh family oxidoreductase n=1 Tax=Bradyrhizobium nitroreducens TaxID=709803 RepID=UPI001374E406|nr:Ldh family oxidoreductase [Bradyrhizobium nitroreducens]
MPVVRCDPLLSATTTILQAAGCGENEAAAIAQHLIDANLCGHDSHGVIRLANYVEWIASGTYFPNRTAVSLLETSSILLLDANFGLGQMPAETAVLAGTKKAAKSGLALVGIRNAGYLGRIGAWAEIAAAHGMASLHFVNGPAARVMVPFGGSDRRLGTTPIAIGLPIDAGNALVFDASTSATSVGKVQLAKNMGASLPESLIVDASGRPSTNPEDFFAGGALLPMSGHKGFGLNVLVDLLTGLVTGGGSSSDTTRQGENMLSIYISRDIVGSEMAWRTEIERFSQFVKASPRVGPNAVRLPGENASMQRIQRRKTGISIDDKTWSTLTWTAASLGLDKGILESASDEVNAP